MGFPQLAVHWEHLLWYGLSYGLVPCLSGMEFPVRKGEGGGEGAGLVMETSVLPDSHFAY